MIPLHRQLGWPREIHRIFNCDLVAQPFVAVRKCKPLDRVFARTRWHVSGNAGRVRFECNRIDDKRVIFPLADGMAMR